jgi:hypothetical protein
MNDVYELELRKLVESVVRPVVAVRATKRRMREELLAHVQAVFDDELVTSGNESSAWKRTQERFGEPRESTVALQASIGRRERMAARLEPYMQVMWEPGDTVGSLLLRQAAQIGLYLALLLPLLTVASLLTQRPGGVTFAVRCSFAMALMLPVFVGAFTFVPINFGDVIFGRPEQRSRRAMALYAIGSVVCLPVIAFSFYYTLTGDLQSALRHGLWGCLFAPANLFLFYVAGRLAYRQSADDHRWVMLNLEE